MKRPSSLYKQEELEALNNKGYMNIYEGVSYIKKIFVVTEKFFDYCEGKINESDASLKKLLDDTLKRKLKNLEYDLKLIEEYEKTNEPNEELLSEMRNIGLLLPKEGEDSSELVPSDYYELIKNKA